MHWIHGCHSLFLGPMGPMFGFPAHNSSRYKNSSLGIKPLTKKTQEAVADTIHPHITSYYPVKNLSLVLDPVICGVPILRHPSLRHKKRPGVGGHQACKAWISQRQHFVKQRGFCEVHLHCGSTWKMTVRRKLEVVRDIFVILWYDMPGLNALSFDLMAFQLACLGHRLPKSDSVTTRESKRSTGGGKQPRKLQWAGGLSQTFPFFCTGLIRKSISLKDVHSKPLMEADDVSPWKWHTISAHLRAQRDLESGRQQRVCTSAGWKMVEQVMLPIVVVKGATW